MKSRGHLCGISSLHNLDEVWHTTCTFGTYLNINSYPSACLMIISLMCLRKDSLESKKKPKCLCPSRVTTSLPLKIRGGWIGLLFLCEKITWMACSFLSGLNWIFYWYAHFSRMNWFTFSVWENNVNDLLIFVWIKLDFPLVCPFFYKILRYPPRLVHHIR